MEITSIEKLAPLAIEEIQIRGAVLELPAKQHCQFSPFGPLYEVNGLDWQCYLAGSSKTAPRILIFSIAIGADYSFDIKSGFSIAPAFSLHNNFDVASVTCQCLERQEMSDGFNVCPFVHVSVGC